MRRNNIQRTEFKNRFLYTEGSHAYEVDVFQGDFKGLVLVDVEFASLKDKADFVPQSWVLKEVTQEEFIAGGILCGKKYGDIEGRLKKFGYENPM